MLSRFWRRAFLAERPSLSLSLFRIALALAVGLHVIPTLLQMQDNYLAESFRELNSFFFPSGVLKWVYGNSDAFVWGMAFLFLASWGSYLIGFLTRLSGAAMMLATYYFYARNSLHIGTLSFDILLVTMFLAVLTSYPGDSFSLDSALRGDALAFKRTRPFFIQRLLQLQVAQTYFCTGLSKWTAGGNWITGNPYYYLMNNPPTGVMKRTWLMGFLADKPHLCHAIGIGVIVFEMSLPLWLFLRKTRAWAIAAGIAFQVLLVWTMHVPTIFFFLFPPRLLLFVDPERLVAAIESRRGEWAARRRDRLVFDGFCGFCRASMESVKALDFTGRIEMVDFRAVPPEKIHPGLSLEDCVRRIQLLESGGRRSDGFHAFRRLCGKLALLWPLCPFLYLPGAAAVGTRFYDWVSMMRFRISVWIGRSHPPGGHER